MTLSTLAKAGLVTIYSLWPSDAIWRQGSRSILVQVMACCLMAPSHYLSQWSSDVHLWAILLEISKPSVNKLSLKIIFLGFYWKLPGANDLTFWGSNKMTQILQLIFPHSFSSMKSLYVAKQATSHYLSQCWPSFPTHICVAWPQWVTGKKHFWLVLFLF